MSARRPIGRLASGAMIVEFAVIAAVLLTMLLTILDFGRILYTWNTAAEATRWGARIAIVCDKATPSQVRAKMRSILPDLTDAQIAINYFDPEGTLNNSCDRSNCKGVEVSLTGFSVQPISPFVGLVIPQVPAFRTYLPRESMTAVNTDGDMNPVCS